MTDEDLKPASTMSDTELKAALESIGKRWDDFRNDPEFEGHGGSPGEWMWERMGELEHEIQKRKFPV